MRPRMPCLPTSKPDWPKRKDEQMKNCDMLVTADIIVTQNPEREILKKAAIAISGTLIDAIGPAEELENNWLPKERRNLGHALIMPGLVNAHTHVPMTLLRGMADDLPLMEWLQNHIFPREAKLRPHMLEIGTWLGCAEMLRTGTTACADMYLNEAHVYRPLGDSGMKALVGEGISAFPSIGCLDPDCIFDVVREQAAEIKAFGNPRLRYAIAPHAVYTTNLDILERSAAVAEELGLPLHTHMSESPIEVKQSLELYGCRPVEVFNKAGALGPNTMVAHGVELEPDEISLLVEKGVSLLHCPQSNMKLASGISPVPQVLKSGLNVAMGTDGAASNNTLNMFSEMHIAALLHKANTLDPTCLPAQTVLDMGTINGGRAMGWPELGCLVPGGPADLCALDLGFPNLAPISNAVSHLIYAASGHEVFLTMVDGKVLYENGKFNNMDYPAILKEAQDICDWLTKND